MAGGQEDTRKHLTHRQIFLKTPICSFDARTGILCPKCEDRLRTGHISRADVEASVRLTKAAERVRGLNQVTLMKAYTLDGEYVLQLAQGGLSILRSEQDAVKEIEGSLGGRTWIVEADTSERRFLEELFYPAKILAVNIVWLPDGSKLTKAIVRGRHTERFPHDMQLLKRIAKEVRGIDLLVEFER